MSLKMQPKEYANGICDRGHLESTRARSPVENQNVDIYLAGGVMLDGVQCLCVQ